MASILVLAGGTSDEREVSLRSGAAVVQALQAAGHSVQQLDPRDGLQSSFLEGCDVVFPVLHGFGGEDGSIQQLLDDLGVAYVGSDVASSKLCFDKLDFKQLILKHSLPTPAGELVDEQTLRTHPLTKRPFVLKPYDGGSSVDTFIIRDVSAISWKPMLAAVAQHGEMLLESLIDGTEITIAVLGEQALPVIEIIPPTSGEFDYENKYNGKTQELCPPLHVSSNTQIAAQELAVKVHKLCGCRDFSRIDMIVEPGGGLQILETNTIPGMTDQSLVPKAAATAGISMPKLVDQLVTFALARKTK